MKVNITDAADRLTKTKYNGSYTDYGFYECGKCGQAVRFRTEDFRRHSGADSARLAGDMNDVFCAARPLLQYDWVLDFRCPGCSRPVRIIYTHGDSLPWNTYGYEALQVLECDDNEKSEVAGNRSSGWPGINLLHNLFRRRRR